MTRTRVFICLAPEFKPGDPAPSGYLDWHEWARVQHKAGLRQQRCSGCLRFRFPQETCCDGAPRLTPSEWRRVQREGRRLAELMTRRARRGSR